MALGTVLPRYPQVVHVYSAVSHGRRFYRTLEYTTNCKLCLRDLQPSIANRQRPWPTWGRHEATTEGFALQLQSLSPPAYAKSVVITRRAPGAAAGADGADAEGAGGAEMFMPSKLLHGLLPCALLDAHMFWQRPDDSIYATPKEASEGHTLEVALAPEVPVQGQPGLSSGLYARVTRRDPGPNAAHATLVLMNLMFAPVDTPAHALLTVLSRLENVAHIVAWAHPDDPARPVLVQLPRLRLTFRARTVTDEHRQSVTRLYSADHAHLYIPTAPAPESLWLLQGIPHAVLLATDAGERLVLVPNLHVVRPVVATSPFSCEVVLNRSGHTTQTNKLGKRYEGTRARACFSSGPGHPRACLAGSQAWCGCRPISMRGGH